MKLIILIEYLENCKIIVGDSSLHNNKINQ